MRRYDKHLQRAHEQLQTWASWEIRNANSGPLGCQAMNYDGMPSCMPGKSIVPENVRPAYISRVYWEIHDAPDIHRVLIYKKYIEGIRTLSERKVTRMLEYMAARLKT